MIRSWHFSQILQIGRRTFYKDNKAALVGRVRECFPEPCASTATRNKLQPPPQLLAIRPTFQEGKLELKHEYVLICTCTAALTHSSSSLCQMFPDVSPDMSMQMVAGVPEMEKSKKPSGLVCVWACTPTLE